MKRIVQGVVLAAIVMMVLAAPTLNVAADSTKYKFGEKDERSPFFNATVIT
jgi:hypothetical protein